MKVLLMMTAIASIAVVMTFFIWGQKSASGSPIGLINSQLAKCSASPNCVCSEYKSDTGHFIAPISVADINTSESKAILQNAIKKMGGKVENQQENYIAATFTSRLFRFVDDLEIRIDPSAKIIHIRSASRVGYSDIGVNRKRVETLKRLLKPEKR